MYGSSVEQKLEASFKLFDENKDGQLSREEIENMFSRTVKIPSLSTTLCFFLCAHSRWMVRLMRPLLVLVLVHFRFVPGSPKRAEGKRQLFLTSIGRRSTI